MRVLRLFPAAAVMAVAGLAVAAGPVVADSPGTSPDASAASSASDGDAAPAEAGTSFRTAVAIGQGQRATASGSAGDYLYWVFPADSGEHVTVRATVVFPESVVRHGPSTWQVDVFDGLRRRQACRFGAQTRTVAADAASAALTCRLRTVRAWAEPWSNDPLRGAYYIRLTVLGLPPVDVGQPVRAVVEATSSGTGGAQAVDGSVAPVVPAASAAVAPAGGWAGTWWSPRWLWTAGGGLLAALFAVGAHRLARGPVVRVGPVSGAGGPTSGGPAGYAG